MYSVKNFFQKEPTVISAAVMAWLNFAVFMDWVHMTSTQVGALNTAVGVTLMLFVRTQSTPRVTAAADAAAAANVATLQTKDEVHRFLSDANTEPEAPPPPVRHAAKAVKK